MSIGYFKTHLVEDVCFMQFYDQRYYNVNISLTLNCTSIYSIVFSIIKKNMNAHFCKTNTLFFTNQLIHKQQLPNITNNRVENFKSPYK